MRRRLDFSLTKQTNDEVTYDAEAVRLLMIIA
jgi:hypothetical protein